MPPTAANLDVIPADANHASPLRILVVEDNADLCQLVCELLNSFGHNPLPAGSAEEALAQFDAGIKFDILLTDVSLPGMSGIDLARTIVGRSARVQVIFASGYGNMLTDNVGFTAHSLTKPYDIVHLDQLLTSLAPAARSKPG